MIFDILPSEMLLEINKHLDVYSRTKFSISQEVLMKTYIKSIENFNLETSEFIDTKLI